MAVAYVSETTNNSDALAVVTLASSVASSGSGRLAWIILIAGGGAITTGLQVTVGGVPATRLDAACHTNQIEVWYFVNPPEASTEYRCTWNSLARGVMHIYQFSGVNASIPVRDDGVQTGTTGTTTIGLSGLTSGDMAVNMILHYVNEDIVPGVDQTERDDDFYANNAVRVEHSTKPVDAANENMIGTWATNGQYYHSAMAMSGDPNNPPTITSVYPSEGPSLGGTPVTITGEFFYDVDEVAFGGAVAEDVVVVSTTTVTCTTTHHAAAIVDVTLEDNVGNVATLADGFEYTGPDVPTGTVFAGWIKAIRPSEGQFGDRIVAVEVHDWAGFMSRQDIGIHGIESDKRADQAIISSFANIDILPDAVDLDNGIETFPLIFNTDADQESLAAFLQKVARNELGRIYVRYDGTLRFENRNVRPENVTSAFTLDENMKSLKAHYDTAKGVFNDVKAQFNISRTDAAATTILWALQDQAFPAIAPGDTLEMLCKFTDPATGNNISASSVEDPILTIDFGTLANGSSNNLDAYISQDNKVGGSSMLVRLTNTHPNQTGFLNDLQIKGKGIYTFDPITIQKINQVSIDSGIGRLKLAVSLDNIVDATKAANYAAYILDQVATPRLATVFEFLANQDSDLVQAMLTLEVSDRFTAVESVTGVNKDFYVNNMRFSFMDGILLVQLIPQTTPPYSSFVWDVSHWDDTDDAHWGL